MLGSDAKVSFEQQGDGLHPTGPTKPLGEAAYVYRISLDGAASNGPK